MRRIATAVVVAAVCALAAAALVDAFTGGSEEAPPRAARGGGAASATVTRTAPAALPACRPGQITLAIEETGTTWAVLVTHLEGSPCRARNLTLELFVTDRAGETTSLPLGEERILDGEYRPGYGRSVPFSICQEGAPFSIEAQAGRYRATGLIPARSGTACHSAGHARTFHLGSGPRTDRFFFESLDPTTHTFTVRVELPHRADVSVEIVTASGLQLQPLRRGTRRDCPRRERRDVCLVRYGLLPEQAAGTWTVVVHKRSRAPAVVRVSTTFVSLPGP